MKPVLVLVITKETPLQDGLVALLTTIPRRSAVLIAEDCPSGLRMVAGHRPQLIIVDLALPDDGAVKLIRKINTDSPGAKTIALVENPEHSKRAVKLGVKTVLYKGFSASVLVKIIEDILG